MPRNNQRCVANLDNLKSLGASTNLSAGGASLHSRMKTVSMAALALALSAVVALAPFAAQAAADTWNGATSNAWETATNWSAGAPITTSAVTISNLTNNPVQINSNVSLNGTTGALILGTAPAPGTANGLNINSGFTLTMGARPVTLNGGSITGLGTLSATTGTISGYGTISSLLTATMHFSATATDGTAFGGFSPFVNGTPGTPITFIGQSLTSDSFAISSRGNYNFQGVTLTTPTLSGVSNNLNAGSVGGNNYYGLLSFSGAASTVVGNVNNTNYEQFDINGTTLHLNNFSLSNSWATNVPPFFVINAGGTLDNTVGNSNLTGHMAVVMNGGSLTNSGGGTFTAPGLITGTGLVSGPMTATGGLTASGGLLTVDGTAGGGITAASAGWGTAGSGNVLDLKGTINFSPSGGFPAAPALNPNLGTVQLDGVTINTTGGSGQIQVNNGQVNVASGVNTLNGAFTPGGTGTTASYSVANGATLSLQNPTSLTNAISGTNFTMAKGSQLVVGGSKDGITLSGSFSFQQTDTTSSWTYASTPGLGPDLTMTGGTSSVPTILEVGGINLGFLPAGFIKNFALASLTINTTGYVDLMDQFANATPLGWTSGSEALYLDNLFGTSKTSSGTLNLDGLSAYLQGYGLLKNGIFTDANGNLVDIVGAPVPVPEPATITMMLAGFSSLYLLAVRRRKSEVARATP
jgi:fibronectin-binding autotransporter adhesin